MSFPAGGYLDCFQFFAIMNIASWNFFFFKDFIYLREREHEQGQKEREKQASR